MKKIFYILLLFTITVYGQDKISDNLSKAISNSGNDDNLLVWIFFTDKGNETDKYFADPVSVVSKKSLNRRMKNISFGDNVLDFTDLPVNAGYINLVENIGFAVRQKSKWFNGISGYTTKENISQIESFPFVEKIDLVYGFKKDYKTPDNDKTAEPEIVILPEGTLLYNYGISYTQLQQINVPAVHDLGYRGQGVTVCVMDAGFNRLAHESFSTMNIIAAWDFVNGDSNVGDENDMGTGTHGTQTLSTIGGFKEGQLIGPAFDADYILAKTENTDSETPIEEDHWVAAMEWADSIGVDVTSTSLGYLFMDPGYPGYTWQNMNGNTAIITKGADLAAHKGIVVVNSAGNEAGNGTPNTLSAPADGDSVIAVGAVSSTGTRVSFSSYGPTVDGRIKPDVMAMGSGVYVASPYNNTQYTYSSGTSFSCPLAAGVAALILSYNPFLTPMQVRDAMRNTASRSSNPDSLYGWGILNALSALNYFPIVDPPELSIVPEQLFFSYTIGGGPSYAYNYQLSGNNLIPSSGNITLTSTINYEISSDNINFSSSLNIPYSGGTLNSVPVYVRLIAGLSAGFYGGTIINEGGGDTTKNVMCFGNVISIFYPIVYISNGWNLVSIPGLHPINQSVDMWWSLRDPGANVFRYNGGYQSILNASPGAGYWMKHNGNNTYNTGDEWPAAGINIVPHDPIPGAEGWNLFGGYEQGVQISGITTTPPGLISGSIYRYNAGYHAATFLEPGYGYWVQLSAAGSINIPAGGEKTGLVNNLEALTEDLGKIIITDNSFKSYTLYSANSKTDLTLFELPPLPPQGMFDIRYSSHRYAEDLSSTQIIEMSGVQYPVKIKAVGTGIVLSDETGKETARLKPGEEVVLNTPGNKLLVSDNIIPSVYSLEQNYPNPFNPGTTIQFSIPEDVQNVKLIVYNALGEKVADLVNKGLQAGIYKYNWNADSYASGIYIYQIITEKFISMKKMILLK